jgi:hypothetical protein
MIVSNVKYKGFESFTTVTVKKSVFWDVRAVWLYYKPMFRKNIAFIVRAEEINAWTVANRLTTVWRVLSENILLAHVISTLKMGATRFSETSVYNKPTRCHIPEDGILCKGIIILFINLDRLCGVVVRVLGYRSGGSGSIPGTTRKRK